MKRKLILFMAMGLVFCVSAVVIASRTNHNKVPPVPASPPCCESEIFVAGPGRVEPASEDIRIGSELSGKIRSVLVEEGDPVHRGQIIAVLVNDDYHARVLSAEAEVGTKDATLRKVLNGSRPQERAQAQSTVRGAKAVVENDEAELERRKQLYGDGIISREEIERYRRQYDVDRANYQEATERYSLVDDRARQEDQDFAQADLRLAKAHLLEAQAMYEKTLIRAPISGTVLRKHHRDGESVSNSSTVPDPILTVGNKGVVRVRVDVDETDVSKILVGQEAYVTADAFGKEKFWGRVIRVGQQLGPKNIRTDAPGEHVDTKILETLVELEKGASLPMGLRVDAYILTNGGRESHRQPGH